MQNFSKFFHSPKGDHRGSALIITLAFVVLLTIVIVAFFSRAVQNRQISTNRAGQLQAEILGRSVFAFILADLRQEMLAGSKQDGTPTGASYDFSGLGPRIFIPSTHLTTVPSRTGFTPGSPGSDPLANVLKISRQGTAFFSGVDYNTSNYPAASLASAVNTSDPAASGRFLSNRDWNKPQLIDANAVSSNPKELISGLALPDWIYVTSGTEGRKVIAAPEMEVVGRYAFIVYDEGGLLDINVAGNPSSLPATEAARKGPLALADLTQIPGFDTAKVDKLINWRNHSSAATGTFSGTAYPLPSATAPDYLKYIYDGSLNRGFLQTYPGDQRFVSRTDLLQYQAANPSDLPISALPYLGTFTRSMNAPTWIPATPAGSTIDYAAQAETSGLAPPVSNRDTVNIRWPADKTISRPTAQGGTETIQVKKGDLLFQRRFPLSKINLLSDPTAKNVNSPVAKEIEYYFGLRWVNSDIWLAEPHFEYLHANNDSSYPSPGGRKFINTPEEVAALSGSNHDTGNYPREPDFFETLQAGILAGSITNLTSDVFQLGLNIIDQYDTDSRPTIMTLAPDGTSRFYAGVENLPYISEILWWPYRTSEDPTRFTFESWLVPELWNPHRNAASPSSNPADPTSFRILIDSTTAGQIVFAQINGGPAASPAGTIPPWGTIPGLSVAATNADDTKPAIIFTSGTFFTEPATLSPAQVTSTPNNSRASLSEGGTGRTGFYLGSAIVPDKAIQLKLGLRNPVPPPSPTWKANTAATLTATNGKGSAAFKLQYQDPSDLSWHTFDRPTAINFQDPAVWTTDARQGADDTGSENFDASPCFFLPGYWARRSFGKVDPRITGINGQLAAASDSTTWPMLMMRSTPGRSLRPNPQLSTSDKGLPRLLDTSGVVDSAVDQYISDKVSAAKVSYPGGWSENLPESINHYADPDGIVRPGDGARGVFPLATGKLKDRPVILNRPFRNVGELGYAFRGKEWKTLDLSSSNSSDAGLLDLFSISDQPVLAGSLNLNTRRPEVLKAVLSGALKEDFDANAASAIDPETATTMAQAIVNQTVTAPLINRSEIATRLAADLALNPDIKKTDRETIVRALSEPGDTRIWNLLIDIVVQAGRFPNNATQISRFEVQGEHRYWLHLAIDRYTGKVVDKQLESVYEN